MGAPTITITSCPSSSDTKTVTIEGYVKDTNDSRPSLTVNGKSVSVSSYNGSWETTLTLTEGDNDVKIIATNNLGKSTTETRTISFGVGAPTITITSCPSSSDTKSVTIEGYVKDTNDSRPSLTVNGKSVSVSSYNGHWETTLTLTEGENDVKIEATNNLGKSTTETRTINFGVGAPTITITSCPSSSDTKSVTIEGYVKDTNDSRPSLTVNGKSVSVSSYNGHWETTLTLTEGENDVKIEATNNLGKSTTETRTINFGVGAPTITINSCPSSSDTNSVTIEGYVSDTNDSRPKLTVNGKNVSVSSYNGSWSTDVSLSEGENTITITATNNLGKSSTETRTVTFSAGSPDILFLNCPETTSRSEITIKGKITGSNSGAMMFINDEEVRVTYSNEFSKTYTLKEGENKFVFRAVNGYGKETTVTKTITYTSDDE